MVENGEVTAICTELHWSYLEPSDFRKLRNFDFDDRLISSVIVN